MHHVCGARRCVQHIQNGGAGFKRSPGFPGRNVSRNKNRHVARAMGKGHGGSANSYSLAASMLRNQCTTFAARGVARSTSKTAGWGSNADLACVPKKRQETTTVTSLARWGKGTEGVPTRAHWLLACLGTNVPRLRHAASRATHPKRRGWVQTLTRLVCPKKRQETRTVTSL